MLTYGNCLFKGPIQQSGLLFFEFLLSLSHAFTMATSVSFKTAIHVQPGEDAGTYSADLQWAWSVGTGKIWASKRKGVVLMVYSS